MTKPKIVVDPVLNLVGLQLIFQQTLVYCKVVLHARFYQMLLICPRNLYVLQEMDYDQSSYKYYEQVIAIDTHLCQTVGNQIDLGEVICLSQETQILD